jgi:transposase
LIPHSLFHSGEPPALPLDTYSPDWNPIEEFFSRLKPLLRKAAKRSMDELGKEI